MKQKSLVIVTMGLCWIGAASLAFCADVAGTVLSDQGDPVPTVRIIAQAPAGKIVNQAVSDANGKYQITGLDPGTYTYTLDPLQTRFKGGTAVSYLSSKGLTINWKVALSKPALALASEGTETAQAGDPFGFSDTEFASLVLGGAGVVGAGVVGGYGAAGGFSSSSNNSGSGGFTSTGPASPAQ